MENPEALGMAAAAAVAAGGDLGAAVAAVGAGRGAAAVAAGGARGAAAVAAGGGRGAAAAAVVVGEERGAAIAAAGGARGAAAAAARGGRAAAAAAVRGGRAAAAAGRRRGALGPGRGQDGDRAGRGAPHLDLGDGDKEIWMAGNINKDIPKEKPIITGSPFNPIKYDNAPVKLKNKRLEEIHKELRAALKLNLTDMTDKKRATILAFREGLIEEAKALKADILKLKGMPIPLPDDLKKMPKALKG